MNYQWTVTVIVILQITHYYVLIIKLLIANTAQVFYTEWKQIVKAQRKTEKVQMYNVC